MTIRYVFAASAALSLGASPVLAQPAQTSDDTRRVAVSYADLNLQTAQGQAVLMARVHRAAEAVCGPSPDSRDLKAFLAFQACMKKSLDEAVAAIPAASQLAGRSRPAG